MEPYYDEDGITIYHGDCRDVLPEVRADVLITDPPYGVGLVAKTVRNKGGGEHVVGQASVLYPDDPDEVRAMLAEVIPLALSRVDRGIIFPGPAMLWSYPEPATLGAVHMVAGGGRSAWGFKTFQPILFYGGCPYLADGKGNRPAGFVATAPPDEGIDHPCPKPLKWMTWAVNRASRPGETILDPFVGSGTTLVAALADGRRAIGIELEEHYCEIAAKRLAQGVLELKPA